MVNGIVVYFVVRMNHLFIFVFFGRAKIWFLNIFLATVTVIIISLGATEKVYAFRRGKNNLKQCFACHLKSNTKMRCTKWKCKWSINYTFPPKHCLKSLRAGEKIVKNAKVLHDKPKERDDSVGYDFFFGHCFEISKWGKWKKALHRIILETEPSINTRQTRIVN